MIVFSCWPALDTPCIITPFGGPYLWMQPFPRSEGLILAKLDRLPPTGLSHCSALPGIHAPPACVPRCRTCTHLRQTEGACMQARRQTRSAGSGTAPLCPPWRSPTPQPKPQSLQPCGAWRACTSSRSPGRTGQHGGHAGLSSYLQPAPSSSCRRPPRRRACQGCSCRLMPGKRVLCDGPDH